jgi:hypothetical protein
MSNQTNPYSEALEFIRRNPGTSGAAGLAKLVLSLYNILCGYSFAECIGSLDDKLTNLCLRMVNDYAVRGETNELRDAGDELSNKLYPGLWEMGVAMDHARQEVRAKWDRERRQKETSEIETAERALLNGEKQQVPFDTAKRMLAYSDGMLDASYYQAGDWRNKNLSLDKVLSVIQMNGTSLTNICPESSRMLAIQLDGQLFYIPTDYDASEDYLASLNV